MAEEGSSKVRLVRCPKCANLLREIPSYSVYRCGGCGALLRAKKKVTVNVGLLERHGEGFEKLESLSEIEDVSSEAFEVEGKKKDGIFLDRGQARVFNERTVNLVSNYEETSIDGRSRIVNEQILDYQRGAEKGNVYKDRYRAPLKQPIRNWVGQNDEEMNMNRSESANSIKEKYIEKFSAHSKGSVGSLRSRAIVGKWGLDGDSLGEPHGDLRVGHDRRRYLNFAPYPDGGPSNYNYMKSSSYAHDQLLKNFDIPDGPNRFAHLEQDRAELLRKLDELKEQICRSSPVIEKQREPAAIGVKFAPSVVYNHDRDPYNVCMKPLAPDKNVPGPVYFRQNGYEHVVLTGDHKMEMQNFYLPQKHDANKFPVHKDPIQSQMPRLDSHQSPGHYMQQPFHDYYLETHMDFDREHLAPYPPGTFYHEPDCACVHCYNKKQHVPSQAPASIFGRRNFVVEPTGSNFNHHANLIKCASQNRNPEVNHHAMHSRDAESRTRWPRDIESDMDVFNQRRLKRVVAARGNGRICHPIAGGIPFIACCSCFELLKLPRKLGLKENNQRKLQCGACSTKFLVELMNKKLIISISEENKQILSGANDGSRQVSREQEVLLRHDSYFTAEEANCSVDLDNVGYDVHSVDFKDNIQPEQQRLDEDESRKRHGISCLPAVSSEEEEIMDSMIVHRAESDHELPVKEGASPTFEHSLVPEHLDVISSNHNTIKNGEGNKSNIIDKEAFTVDKSYCHQKSDNNVSSETEVEVSFSEVLTTTSQDSLKAGKEDLQPRINKGSESFLVGLLKKSLRDFSRSNQQSEGKNCNVFVNGQPILDSMVKKAEKLAGPIHPGDYWYDSRAGFWGLMGQHCLGIIPPHIEEFKYPMPANCSSGNTSIFVNGRELHQKDLDLLESRGLPPTKDKSYIIEISGRVLEKVSGRELKRLGKLAPTVEKMKRGFGMKVPRRLM